MVAVRIVAEWTRTFVFWRDVNLLSLEGFTALKSVICTSIQIVVVWRIPQSICYVGNSIDNYYDLITSFLGHPRPHSTNTTI